MVAMARAVRIGAAIFIACVAFSASVASASNMTHPRTPVLWQDVPCMTLHDRSKSATVHLPYAIPFEDTEPGPGEVADSRTHQFFAFCRSHSGQDFLPTWITAADVEAAVGVGIVRAGTVMPDDIMEQSVQWDECWFRINADDERRPIDFASAAAGVDWDTTDLAPGGYSVEGYTYEPVFNVWVRRPGVIKLHDGDPDAVGPVAAISTGELTPYRDDTVVLEGCVDALPGTTFSVQYALTSPDEPEWFEYLSQQPISDDAFAFELTPPAEIWGQSALIRVDFIDPMGREYAAYQPENLLVIDLDNPESCGDVGAACDPSSTDDAGESTSTTTSTGEGSATTSGEGTTSGASSMHASDQDGCGCGSVSPTTGSLAALLVLLRRRARGRRRQTASTINTLGAPRSPPFAQPQPPG